ncbi:MAG: DNA adenine methylase [Armatimonadota bacterium]
MTSDPFLKWPGGKRWLAPSLLQYYPSSYRCYYEPFLGGGASFFALRPSCAVLSDTNIDLVNTYLEVRDNVECVIEMLTDLAISTEVFHELRGTKPTHRIDIAVRMIYLSKTAFNGMYRVNRRGEFNVPFGCKPSTKVCDAYGLRNASSVLRRAKILHADFEEAVADAREGDLVYFDPPYTVRHDNNGFLRYNEAIFSWEDQQRLAVVAHQLVERGVHVYISNAAHESVIELYNGFNAIELTRASCISATPAHRTKVKEYLFYSPLMF